MALKLAVLISGRGSNLAALARAIAAGECSATIPLVVSDRSDAPGLAFARSSGFASAVVRMQDHDSREAWDRALTNTVSSANPDLVVLAGFMRLLGPEFIARFAGRIVNVHPALLPLFRGIRAPEQALQAGVRVSGCSVHVVDNGIDTGPVIAQAVVPIAPDDSPQTLHARIQRVEHVLLPQVIAAIADGRITLTPQLQVRASPQVDSTLFSLDVTSKAP